MKKILLLLTAVFSAAAFAVEPVFAPGIAAPEKLAQYRQDNQKNYQLMKQKMAAHAKTIRETALPEIVRERCSKRMEIVDRLLNTVLPQRMAKSDTDNVLFSRIYLRDLETFDRYFTEEVKYGKEVLSLPEPLRFSVKDFGAKGDGKHDDAPAFNAAMDKIRKLNGRPAELIIPEGSYLLNTLSGVDTCSNQLGGKRRFNHNGPSDLNLKDIHLLIHDLTNVTIRGTAGKTHLLFGQTAVGSVIAGCRNLTLQGVTMRFVKPTFMQSTLVEADFDKKFLIVDVDENYPLPDDPTWVGLSVSCTQAYGKDGKLDKPGSDIYWNGKYEHLGGRRYKMFYSRLHHKGVKPGVKMYFPIRKNTLSGIQIRRSAFCTLKDSVIYNAGAASCSTRESYVSTLDNLKIIPAPGTWMSGSADASFNSQNEIGPYLKNCTFLNFGDDGINVFGYGENLYKRNGSIFTVQTRPRIFAGEETENGDTTRVLPRNVYCYVINCKTGQILADGKVKTIRKVFKEQRFTHVEFEFEGDAVEQIRSAVDIYPGKRYDQLIIDDPKAEAPDMVFFFQQSGAGTVITNCVMGNNRHNSVTLQSTNALIENSRFEDASFGGIVFSFYSRGFHAWREGPASANVIVRNNIISNAFYSITSWHSCRFDNRSAVAMTRDILLENNRISNCINGLFLSNAQNFHFRNNTFTGNGINRIFTSTDCLSENDSVDNARWDYSSFSNPADARKMMEIRSDLPVKLKLRYSHFKWSKEKGAVEVRQIARKRFRAVIGKQEMKKIHPGNIQCGFTVPGLEVGKYQMKMTVKSSADCPIQAVVETGKPNKLLLLQKVKLSANTEQTLTFDFEVSAESEMKLLRLPVLFIARGVPGTEIEYTQPEIERIVK